MTVLLVDSDKLLADNFSSVMNEIGHETVWQVELQAALESMDTKKPDAVVMDINLADRSGVELLYELRSYPEWQKLPIIIWSDAAEVRQGISPKVFKNLGVTSYLPKSTTGVRSLASSLEASLANN